MAVLIFPLLLGEGGTRALAWEGEGSAVLPKSARRRPFKYPLHTAATLQTGGDPTIDVEDVPVDEARGRR